MYANITTDNEKQQQAMRRYYRWQSRIYDLTRWTFLFGRRSVLRHLPFSKEDRLQVLEVGCGTGKNLVALASRFPKASITGLDVSKDMIKAAEKKTSRFRNRMELIELPYGKLPGFAEKFDIILFSYSLTMINPQWLDLLEQSKLDLKKGGYLVVVDFHDSRWPWFKGHMANNHVRMDSHLLPVLKKLFHKHAVCVKTAYGNLWEYMRFVGRKD